MPTRLALLLQTTIPQPGLSLGEWLALISCAIALGALIWRTSRMTALAEAHEKNMNDKHNELRTQVQEQLKSIMDTLARFSTLFDDGRDIPRRVEDLETDMEIVRERTHDTHDLLTPICLKLEIPVPERRHRDRRAS